MSQTLYRKYRPQNFSDVLGQDHIVTTLQNAIALNRIAHAYIFTGPRGTGKTSIARLFAAAVNTDKRKDFTPVSDAVAQRLRSGASLDIIEIDAASRTSVEGIRTLKETVNITPSEAVYKVYIIDEVHMLSTSAFNALLKTLEEPPAHALFILATTEIHKVPETILSRCQRFDFARFTIADIVTKLTTIAQKENVNISPEALEMIAVTARGGMRDAESLLAQAFSLDEKEITAEDVTRILGNTASEEVMHLITACVQKNTTEALTIIHNLVKNGHNIDAFITSVIEKLRTALFISISSTTHNDITHLIYAPQAEITQLRDITEQKTHNDIVMMIEAYTTALQKTKSATIPQLPLEIAVITICGARPTQDTSQPPTATHTQKEEYKKTETTPQKSPTQKSPTKHVTRAKTDVPAQWKNVIAEIEREHKSISTTLSLCTVVKNTNSTLTIATDVPFYQEKLLHGETRALIEKIMYKHFAHKIQLEVITKEKDTKPSSELLSYATHIMGGTIAPHT